MFTELYETRSFLTKESKCRNISHFKGIKDGQIYNLFYISL